jgi:hypothetical protein
MVVERWVWVQRFVTLTGLISATCWVSCAGAISSLELMARDYGQPLWTEHLTGRNGESNSFKMRNPARNELGGVTFLDDNLLIVYAVEPTGRLSSRVGVEPSSAFRLHALFFGADSGKLAFAKDWEARARNSFIHVTSGGLVLATGPEIAFYSGNFLELQHVLFPEEDTSVVTVSKTGRTVLLNHYDRKESHFEVRDGSTFELRKSWSEVPPLRRLYSISDSEIAAADPSQEHVVLSEFGSGRWRTLGYSFEFGCVGAPTFVSATLFVNAYCNQVSVFSTQGEDLMNDHSERHESVEGRKIDVARDGNAIAVSLVEGKGGGVFDTDVRRTGNRVAVYDLSLRRRILTIDIVPVPKSDYDFALSPDGSKLAILNDRDVSVYSVPRQSIE